MKMVVTRSSLLKLTAATKTVNFNSGKEFETSTEGKSGSKKKQPMI